MSENVRDIENYAPLSLIALDKRTLESFTLYLVAMRLFKFGSEITPTVEVWEGSGGFEAGMPSNSTFNRSFSLDYQTVKTDYAGLLAPIESAFYDWLEISPDKYDLEMFDINLTNLTIRAKAVHKTNAGKTVEDKTDSLEEFEQIKADYPQLVQAYFQFVLGYALAHDARLVKFNG